MRVASPGGDHVFRALPAEYRQASAVDLAQGRVAVEGPLLQPRQPAACQVHGAFVGIRQAHHVGADPVLSQLLKGPHPGIERGEQHPFVHLLLRQRSYTKPDLRDDAERPLAAKEHLLQIRARGRRGRLAEQEVPARGRHPQFGHCGIRTAVARRRLPGRPGRRVATDRGALPRLRQVTPRETPGLQPPFQFRAGDARLHQHLPGLRIQLPHRIHLPESHSHGQPVGHAHAVDHTGPATEGHHRPLLGRREIQDRPHLVMTAGQQNHIHHRQFPPWPTAIAQVDEGETARAPQSRQVVIDTRQRAEFLGGNPGGTHRHLFQIDSGPRLHRPHSAVIQELLQAGRDPVTTLAPPLD